MKTLGKLGLLFGLIVAGRYMQSVAPVAAGLQQKPPIELLPAPTTVAQYVSLVDTTRTLGQRPAIRPVSDVTWY